MASKVGGPNPQVVTNFDRISQNLDKTADQLGKAAGEQIADAGKALDKAGAHGVDAFANVAGAAANALLATGATIEGAARTAEAAGHLAAAGGLVAAGVAGWATEGVREGGRYVATGAAHGFADIANTFSKVLGDGVTTTVRELQGDPNAVRFSEKMFGKAQQQMEQSGEKMGAAWNSYTEAITNLAGAAVNVGFAAAHVAGVAGNLAKAAALTTSAGATKMAEFGVRLSSVAVQAAEQGVVGARDLAILGAKFSASTANVLANPDQGKVKVDVQQNLSQYQAQLQELVKNNPGLQEYVKPLLAS